MKNTNRINADHRGLRPVSGMKMGRWVIFAIHLDDDAIKPTDLRHYLILPLAVDVNGLPSIIIIRNRIQIAVGPRAGCRLRGDGFV
jgi:hypothetical protein